MRKQQQIWKQEHSTSSVLPSLAQQEPSSVAVFFADFLKDKVKPPAKVVDIGCGKGRNSVYLAKQGFEVYGLDYIQEAICVTQKLADKNEVAHKIHLYKATIDEPWSFSDNFFDIALDCFSSIDIESKEGREKYKQEMFRTLKPGGYVLVAVVSIEDEWESELIKTSPGSEKNSTLWPQNNKFQKDYDEGELKEFYQEFKIVEMKKVEKKAHKLGKDYTATNYWIILQKD